MPNFYAPHTPDTKAPLTQPPPLKRPATTSATPGGHVPNPTNVAAVLLAFDDAPAGDSLTPEVMHAADVAAVELALAVLEATPEPGEPAPQVPPPAPTFGIASGLDE